MEPKLPDESKPAFAGRILGRLKKRAEFQRVSRGRRRAFEPFTLQAAARGPEAPAEGARVGFTVTKKVGNAVVRNRIRRRLKAALERAEPLEAKADCDYVLMARREALARPFAALVDDLRRAFRAVERASKDGRSPRDVNTPIGEIRRP